MKKIATSKGIFHIDLTGKQADGKGEVYVTCPICTPARKPEHQRDTKLAINVSREPNPWRCNHCGEKGYDLTNEYIERQAIKPLVKNYNSLDLSKPMVKWFWEERKISITTLKHFDISLSQESILQLRVKEGDEIHKKKYLNKNCINYKYKRNGILINIKFRDNVKNFKMITGASKIPFNIDSIKDSKECVITEGENDVLAYHEAGIPFVISVPNGATITEAEREEYEKTGKLRVISHINLEYLDAVIDDLEDIETFYLATDDDPPGIKLREELARRLGYERCKYIKFSDYKDDNDNLINDPNELLIKRDKATLAGTLKSAYSFPISNVTLAHQYTDKILKTYRDGKTKGESTGYLSIDSHFTWIRGWPIVLNGYPNMGKTSLALCLMAVSAVKYKWKWGIYCPENYPVENVVEILVMILLGKTTSSGYNKRATEGEIVTITRDFINKYFFFVDNEDGFTPEELRKVKKNLIRQHGIVGFLTDPWSSLNHNIGKFGGVDQYLENELNNEVRVTTKYNFINLICHHPKTPSEIKKRPTVFELNGGKHWWIKMYAALCIHQMDSADWQNNRVGFHVDKVKDVQACGEKTTDTLFPVLRYDKITRRFYERAIIDDPDSKYNRFPFDSYLDTDQKSLFDGF